MTPPIALMQNDDDDYKELIREALQLVRAEVRPSIWKMFEQIKIQNKSAIEVARIHGVSVYTVFNAVRRVMARLREIIEPKDEEDVF